MRLRWLALAVLLASSASAQDVFDPSSAPAPDDEPTDRISLVVHGQASAIASGVVLEFQVRGQGETADDARKAYMKRIRNLTAGMADEARVTTAVFVDVTGHQHERIDGFVCAEAQGQQPPFVKKEGATYSGRFVVAIHGLANVPQRKAEKRLAEVLAKIADNDITGAEDDCDIMHARLEVDAERLRARSHEDAIEKARRRASALARLSQRKLGKMTIVRELSTSSNDEQSFFTANYYDVLFPGSYGGWRATLAVRFETELEVEFELE